MDPSASSAALSPPLQALASLSSADLDFLYSLPKAELHAHLNGCIPFPVLQELAHQYHLTQGEEGLSSVVKEGIDKLEGGVVLEKFQDFFALFPAIYHLTSTPSTIALVTHAVLSSFLAPTSSDPNSANCQYLELRTTPREDKRTGLTRDVYLTTVLNTLDAWNLDARSLEADRAAVEGRDVRPGWGEGRLIVSLDYRMDPSTIRSILSLATSLKRAGRPIVGLDVCGDPSSPPSAELLETLCQAKEDGWELTIHIAELEGSEEAAMSLLRVGPKRVGHGTFLSEAGKEIVEKERMVVEVCLTSNILCMTTPSASLSHLHHYLSRDSPATICTDDTLPFATSLLAEYALLVAEEPFGLGMAREEVVRVARGGVQGRFSGW